MIELIRFMVNYYRKIQIPIDHSKSSCRGILEMKVGYLTRLKAGVSIPIDSILLINRYLIQTQVRSDIE